MKKFLAGILATGMIFEMGALPVLAVESEEDLSQTLTEEGTESSSSEEILPEVDMEPSSTEEVLPEEDKDSSSSEEITPEEDKDPSSTEEVSPEEDNDPSSSEEVSPEEDKDPSSSEEVSPEEDIAPPSTEEISPEEDKEPSSSEEVSPEEDNDPSSSEEVTPEEDKAPSSSEDVSPEEDKDPSSSEEGSPEEDKDPSSSEEISPELDMETTMPEDSTSPLTSVDSSLLLETTLQENVSTITNTENQCGDSLTWEFNASTGTLTISGTGAMYDYGTSTSNVTPWVSHKADIKDVVIGVGVTSIGDSAFYSYTNLETISFESGSALSSIGAYAFINCTSLQAPIIPETVTAIGAQAFSRCKSFTSIVLPNAVETLGSSAFSECNALVSVTLPSGLITIEASTFSSCSALEFINIPETVTTIGGSAFSGCSALKSIKIPDAVTTIEGSAFKNCTLLTSAGPTDSGEPIELGWITEIPTSAFTSFTNLLSVELPATVSKIGEDAFRDCTSLAKVVIPSNFETLSENPEEYFNYSIFDNCPELTSLGAIGSGAAIEFGGTVIGDFAFNKSALTEVVLPDSVTSIGENAFSSSDILVKMYIPRSVTSFGFNMVYWSCVLYYAGTEEDWAKVEKEETLYNTVIYNATPEMDNETEAASGDFTYSLNGTDSVTITSYTGTATEVTIPAQVTIDDTLYNVGGISGFCDSEDITKIELSSGITSVDYYAFSNCSNLETFIIPETVTILSYGELETMITAGPIDSGANFQFGWTEKIPDYAFPTSPLEEITLPDTITTIGDYAFSSCYSLSTITLPESLTTLGDRVFGWTWGLTAIKVPEGNTSFCDIDGVLFNDEKTNLIQYPVAKEGNTYEVPSTVTHISDYAFDDCDQLFDISLPEGLLEIGAVAFSGTSIVSMTIPDTVTTIGALAFYWCQNLYSLEYGSGITTMAPYYGDEYIKGDHFYGCNNLSYVVIPSSVKEVSLDLFENSSLSDVYYKGSSADWAAIDGHDESVDSVWNRATKHFDSDMAAIEIEIVKAKVGDGENDYVYFDKSTGMLLGADENIINLDVPTTIDGVDVTSVGAYFLAGNSNIQKVTLPETVTSIGYYSFYQCSNLTEVVIKGDASFGTYAFARCSNLETVTLATITGTFDYNVFNSLNSNAQVNYTGSEEDWANLGLGTYHALNMANITYNYQISEEEQTFLITFDDGGKGFLSDSEGTTDETGLLANYPSFEENKVVVSTDTYYFLGWNTVSDGTGDMISLDTLYTKKTTLYAIWESMDTDDTVLSLEVSSDLLDELEYDTVPQAVQSLFNTSFENELEKQLDTLFSTYFWVDAQDDDVVLPEDLETFTVTESVNNVTYKCIYAFEGWYVKKSDVARSMGDNFVKVENVIEFESGEIILYPYFTTTITVVDNTPTTTYTITFEAEGGSDVSSKVTNTSGTLSSLPTTTRSGYTFLGWYTASTGGTEITKSTKFTKNTTVYAQWTADTTTETETYTVSFDSNSGSAVSSLSTSSDGTLSSLPSSTRTNYSFKGWYTASTGGTKITTSTVFTENTTVYAQWTYVESSDSDSDTDSDSSGSTGSTGSTGSSSSSSSSSSSTSYSNTLTKPSNGSISLSSSSAKSGTTVTIKVTPDSGYEVDTVTVTRSGTAVTVTKNADGTYSFTQPSGIVNVSATFQVQGTTPQTSVPETEAEVESEEITPYVPSFTDVSPTDWFYDAVMFVADEGLMYGVGYEEFAPYTDTSRGMIVTILHSLAGYPTAQGGNQFSDVADSSWYADAVVWASENGVASGMGDNTFAPNGAMTREQLVVMLYGYAQSFCGESVTEDLYLAFADNDEISPWAEEAVAWATAQGIVGGRPDGSFDPTATANRAEVAVILKNFVALYG